VRRPFLDEDPGERPKASSAWDAWDAVRGHQTGRLDLQDHHRDAGRSLEHRRDGRDRKLDGRAEYRRGLLPGVRLAALAEESEAEAEPCKQDEGQSAA